MKTLVKVLDVLFYGGWMIGVPVFKFMAYFLLTVAMASIESIQIYTATIGLGLTGISMLYHFLRQAYKNKQTEKAKQSEQK